MFKILLGIAISLLLADGIFAQTSAANDFPSCGQVVAGGIVNGKASRLVQPPYPPAAKAANLGGKVQVRIMIGVNGDIIHAETVSGDPLLADAALAAARNSKFTPTLISGQPVCVTGVIIYNFTTGDPESEAAEKAVTERLKLFYLAAHLTKVTDSAKPLDDEDERLLTAELGEVAPAKENTPAAKINYYRESITVLKNKLFGADLWLFEVGQLYSRIAQQFDRADGGKSTMLIQQLNEQELKSDLREIKKLTVSIPAEIPVAFVTELNKTVVFADEPDLMSYEKLRELRSTLRRR